MFKFKRETRYRIVAVDYKGSSDLTIMYKVQEKRWWWPFWFDSNDLYTLGYGKKKVKHENWHISLENAKKHREYLKYNRSGFKVIEENL